MLDNIKRVLQTKIGIKDLMPDIKKASSQVTYIYCPVCDKNVGEKKNLYKIVGKDYVSLPPCPICGSQLEEKSNA